jgi:hypothetical protein
MRKNRASSSPAPASVAGGHPSKKKSFAHTAQKNASRSVRVPVFKLVGGSLLLLVLFALYVGNSMIGSASQTTHSQAIPDKNTATVLKQVQTQLSAIQKENRLLHEEMEATSKPTSELWPKGLTMATKRAESIAKSIPAADRIRPAQTQHALKAFLGDMFTSKKTTAPPQAGEKDAYDSPTEAVPDYAKLQAAAVVLPPQPTPKPTPRHTSVPQAFGDMKFVQVAGAHATATDSVIAINDDEVDTPDSIDLDNAGEEGADDDST